MKMSVSDPISSTSGSSQQTHLVTRWQGLHHPCNKKNVSVFVPNPFCPNPTWVPLWRAVLFTFLFLSSEWLLLGALVSEMSVSFQSTTLVCSRADTIRHTISLLLPNQRPTKARIVTFIFPFFWADSVHTRYSDELAATLLGLLVSNDLLVNLSWERWLSKLLGEVFRLSGLAWAKVSPQFQ